MSPDDWDAYMAQKLEDLYADRTVPSAGTTARTGDDSSTWQELDESFDCIGSVNHQQFRELMREPRSAALPDHAEASAKMLEFYAAKIRGGTSPEDLGPEIGLLGRIMARRT